MGKSISAMGTKSFGVWKLAGAAAIYEVAKSGINWLKESNQYQLQYNNALKQTKEVAGTSTRALMEFADSNVALATNGGRQAVLQMQNILLGFKNIRNEGPGTAAVFDRVRQAALDISAKTGRSLTTVAISLGKAFQDPVKYMNTLGRAGVTFNKQQKATVANLIAAGKPLQAQEYMLQQLSGYTGAAAKQAQSFGGQWEIAKEHLVEANGTIDKAFIPTFKVLAGLIEGTAGFLSHHTTAVRNVVLAYAAWKTVMLAVGIGTSIYNNKLVQATLSMMGLGRSSVTAEEQMSVAATGMEAAATGINEQIMILNKQLMGIGPAAEEGVAGADTALGTLDGALATTATEAGAVDAEMTAIGPAAVGAEAVAVPALGGIGAAAAAAAIPVGALIAALGAAYLGYKTLKNAAKGIVGSGAMQTGGVNPYNGAVIPKGMAPDPFNKADPSTYSFAQEMALMNAYLKAHGKSTRTAEQWQKSTDFIKIERAAFTAKYGKAAWNSGGVDPWPGVKPAITNPDRSRKNKRKNKYKPYNPSDFTMSTGLAGTGADNQKFEKLQIAYEQAQLTKSTADDKRVLTAEYNFFNNILKHRKLTLDQRKTILGQMVAIHNSLASLTGQIAKAADPALSKLLGPKFQKLDIAEQKAKRSGNLAQDKKRLKDEEDYIKQLLRNRQLSLASRQKLQHQLTTVEQKIKTINQKMAQDAQDSQTSEMDAFNSLQGSFFGQFAPNVFTMTAKGLTPGSSQVGGGHRRKGHAMGGVIHYASGGAVDTRFVREAPHYASHEARFHRAGLAYFSANSPTREQRRGTDTVPAMLTPGELVLNARQQQALRARLGMPRSGSPEALFNEILQGTNEHDTALVMRLARHQLSMERGGSRAPFRRDVSTWLRQFQGMSAAERAAANQWWGTNYGEVRRGYASGGVVHHKHTHQYVAPFSRKNAAFARVDQGVDYSVAGNVRAIGSGRIVSVTGGMAGGTGTIIKERLNQPIRINGRTYYGIYYSEGAGMVRAGQKVRAGQVVMGGGGVEIGFLNSRMQMPPLRGGLGAGTKPDQQGYDFAKLVRNLQSGKYPGVGGVAPRTTVIVVNNTPRVINYPDAGYGGLSALTNARFAPAPMGTDSIAAMLSPGEMVLNAQQQQMLRQKLGLGALNSPEQLFNAITSPHHFASGGVARHRKKKRGYGNPLGLTNVPGLITYPGQNPVPFPHPHPHRRKRYYAPYRKPMYAPPPGYYHPYGVTTPGSHDHPSAPAGLHGPVMPPHIDSSGGFSLGNEIDMFKQMVSEYRISHGMSPEGGNRYSYSPSPEEIRHYPRTGYWWDSGDQRYRHTSGWSWDAGAYHRRSQYEWDSRRGEMNRISQIFRGGNKQIFNMGQGTRDMFHALMAGANPDDLRNIQAAYQALKIYPKGQYGGGLMAGAGYDAAKALLEAVNPLGLGGNDLFSVFEGPNFRRMGISGLLKRLHMKMNYPNEENLGVRLPRLFSGGGMVPGVGGSDSVPAMLTPGEVILNAAQQERVAHRLDIAQLVGVATRALANDRQGQPGTLHYEQHNTYHELPKDPFAEARAMKTAVAASFHT